jgi:hypothetical protein
MLPALPSTVDPNKYVEFRVFECRTCGEYGPMVGTSDKNDPQHLWDVEHLNLSLRRGEKHDKFYAWTLSRANSRIM